MGLKKAVPFIVVIGLAGIIGGGVVAYQSAEEKQTVRREQAFVDLSQCLFGERVEASDTAANAITGMQARAAHLPDGVRWPEGGSPWPQRCAEPSRELMNALRDSSLWKDEPKRVLMKEVDLLAQDLDRPDAHSAFLTRTVVGLWRAAEEYGLKMGASSSLPGPPKTERIGADLGSLSLPFGHVLPIPDGPVWHFLATIKDKPDAIASCAPSEDGLSCVEFQSEKVHFKPLGSWESPAFLPQDGDRSLCLLKGGTLEKTAIDFPRSVHVDADGTFYVVHDLVETGQTEVTKKLTIRPVGKNSIMLELSKVFGDRVDLSNAVDIFVLGPAVYARLPDKTVRAAVSRDGTVTEVADIPYEPKMCRAGTQFVVGGGAKLKFVDGSKVTELATGAKSDELRKQCSSSGSVQVGGRILCRSTGCVEVFDETGYPLFVKSVQHPLVMDTVGDRIVYTWGAKDGSGLLMHVGEPGLVAEGKDIVIVDKTGGKGPSQMGVFGGDKIALAFANIEGQLIGFRVTASGDVGPIKIAWK